MLSPKRLDKRRILAVAVSCAALAGATLGSALAALNPAGAATGSSAGWASLTRHSMLVAETRGADADELDTFNGWIDDDDQGEVDETESPDPEESEARDESEELDPGEHVPAAVDENDQGDDNDDQGEDEQDEADSGEHDSGDVGEHDSGEHDDGDSGEQDSGGD